VIAMTEIDTDKLRALAEKLHASCDDGLDPDAAYEAGDAILAMAEENKRLREALHEIDIEAANTIPPDGAEAGFAALERIVRIINPFRLTSAKP